MGHCVTLKRVQPIICRTEHHRGYACQELSTPSDNWGQVFFGNRLNFMQALLGIQHNSGGREFSVVSLKGTTRGLSPFVILALPSSFRVSDNVNDPLADASGRHHICWGSLLVPLSGALGGGSIVSEDVDGPPR
eukprot:GHVO01020402.1.p1 GENE.GHVO01020402.1~~GHVO01020402.1.p1  ORF type:complete len:134 (+),score=11.56 GHVO01020402.1:394-795(+)